MKPTVNKDWELYEEDMASMPAPTDEEIEVMIEDMRQKFGEDYEDFDTEINYRGFRYNE